MNDTLFASARHITRSTLFFTAVAIGVGCAAPAGDPDDEAFDENIESSSQAFSGIHGLDWGVTAPNTLQTDIPYNTHSCFLTGAFGNFDSHNQNVWAWVRKPYYSSNWALDINPDSSNPVRGQAACVRSTANRTEEMIYFGGQGAVKLADGAAYPNRRCFLTQVRVRDRHETLPEDFASSADKLEVFQNPITKEWWLGGSANVSGSARCVDVTEDWGEGIHYGPATLPLRPHTSGWQCFLTRVGGAFRTNDWDNGVRTYMNSGLQRWELQVSAGKYAAARCVR